MLLRWLFCLVLVLLCGIPVPSAGQQCDTTVLRIVDGDTFIVATQRIISKSLIMPEETRVHLHGVRTPPLPTAEGLHAKKMLTELLTSRPVGLYIHKSTRFGGFAAEVYLCGQNQTHEHVNTLMIELQPTWKYQTQQSASQSPTPHQQASQNAPSPLLPEPDG